VPAVVVKTIFGQMGEEALLASQRAVPERLLAEGFQFRHAQLEGALRGVLGRRDRVKSGFPNAGGGLR